MKNSIRKIVAMTSTLTILSATPVIHAEWIHAIGTGLTATSLDGDIGFDTTVSGPTVFEVDLDNSEYSDLVDSGFGFVGFSTNGQWTISYMLSNTTIEDNDNTLEAEWDRTTAEILANYKFAATGDHKWGVSFGVRNVAHEWGITLDNSEIVNIDESWTDAVLGLTHTVPISDDWDWHNSLQTTFGDSEGTSSFSSSLAWQVNKNWMINFTASVKEDEFNVGQPGDADFYLYDISEPSFGAGFVYIF